LIRAKDELAKEWNAGSHISAHYKYNQVNNNTLPEILETFNSLVPIYQDICNSSVAQNKTDIEEVMPTYWLYSPGSNASKWDEFYNEGVMGIGWDELDDLSVFNSRESIVEKMKRTYDSETYYMNDSLCCYEFANKLKIGDVVICKKGRKKYIGYGIVDGEYYFDKDANDYKNRIRVHWIKKGEWVEAGDIVLKTLTDINKYPDYVSRLIDLLGIEQGTSINGTINLSTVKYTKKMALKDLFIESTDFNRIVDLLNIKQNIILQGPPGVGKSFISKRIAYSLLGVKDESRVEMIQFHQSYSYEDFIQGYRPADDGKFVLKNGVFYDFCIRAQQNPDEKYVFIIDEINRGNLSKIFGELMLLVENDKRGPEYAISLTYSDSNSSRFYIPSNLYIIGMMNTADRSLAMVDYALRRRFCFIDLLPQFSSKKFKEYLLKHKLKKNLVDRIIDSMKVLNEQITADSDLGIGYQIGHSFFTPTKAGKYDVDWYNQIVDYEVAPLVREYWFDNINKVESAIEELKN